MIDIRDAGKFIAPALLEPDFYNRKSFTCAAKFYTLVEIVKTWSKVTGKEIRPALSGPSSLPPALEVAMKGARGLITVYAYFGPTGQADLDWTLEQLTDKLTSWEQFVEDHKPWFED
ncbi:hypothetical protein OIDMADRAFT_49945 [Oidiodendron maius Zn]|uniref:NmrA-like domain-containing protein n=1 Tax=Oidiodendron maius (strain Zn) TaxID=913774 RepID=A0A0C3HTW2_OIDMZ|nr:hypothetical protein OIDMADRAFT_49945 [Oidiodendron maius Zn]